MEVPLPALFGSARERPFAGRKTIGEPSVPGTGKRVTRKEVDDCDD
jgi:hypothetical protein